MLYKCEHCGTEFPTKQGVRVHLANCKERNLSRFFRLNNYLYCVVGNPKRVMLKALSAMIKEEAAIEPDVLIGALVYLKHTGQLERYCVIEPKTSPGLDENENGLIKTSVIEKCLSTEDKKLLVAANISIRQRGKYYEP